ncbi:hypothetical protein LCGC14_0042830 [marine sediment metagenome]|jgi:hypothetical protein|uniref:Uncharacterized protein n=2 Tax=root TaxID=1 RepID=A0A7V1BHJ4_9RHOB|nr:hypothetical protein [Sulfitobacter litoralis]HDZ53346.1 hypothetical protein [Sulfitobacter litoralis]
MGTKVLKKLGAKAASKPAAISARIRKRGWIVMAAFVIPTTVAAIMILLRLWVPGLAWLE